MKRLIIEKLGKIGFTEFKLEGYHGSLEMGRLAR